jgi:Tol biopolymer transport system component
VFTRTIRDANIWRVALGGGAQTPEKIAVSSFREVAPHYSPDGSRLAFHSNRSGSVQIWVSNADGSSPVQLTSMKELATTGTPRWSPDGKRLAFDSNTTGTYQIYVMNGDGGQARQVTTDTARNFTAWWSADGRSIYYTSDRSGRLEIWRIPADGGTSEQITRNGASSVSLSPDGQWLYFIKNEGIDGLWRMPVAGGPETRVVDALWRFNYVATNSGVYYTSRPEEGPRRGSVQYFDFATRRHTEIATMDAPADLGVAISPDGKYLLFTKIDHLGADLMLVEKFR